MQHLIAKFYFTFLKNLGQNNNEQDFDFFLKLFLEPNAIQQNIVMPMERKVSFLIHYFTKMKMTMI